jgi:hypothetical protein
MSVPTDSNMRDTSNGTAVLNPLKKIQLTGHTLSSSPDFIILLFKKIYNIWFERHDMVWTELNQN